MNEAEFDAHLDQLADQQRDRYRQYLEDIKADAVEWLQSRGLPYAPWIEYETDSGCYEARLGYYLEQQHPQTNGVDRVAGDFITLISGLDEIDQRLREGHIIKIMQAHTKLVMLRNEMRVNQANGKAERKKPWAAELAEELVSNHDKFPDAWRALEKSANDVGDIGFYVGHEVRLQDDQLLAFDDKTGKSDEINKESFRTGYFVPEKRIQGEL